MSTIRAISVILATVSEDVYICMPFSSNFTVTFEMYPDPAPDGRRLVIVRVMGRSFSWPDEKDRVLSLGT